LSDLLPKLLDKVLLRGFLMLYASDFEGDDDRQPYQFGKSRSVQKRAFTLLCSVCWQWCQTLTSWRQSPTGLWLKKLIERAFTLFLPYRYVYLDRWIPLTIKHIPETTGINSSQITVFLLSCIFNLFVITNVVSARSRHL